MTRFTKAMIVFEASEKRVANYHKAKELITDLALFPAIDYINQYERYEKDGHDYTLNTKEFLQTNWYLRGRIGCNLSHIYLLRQFLASDAKWLLVLEDDAGIDSYNEDEMNTVLDFADAHGHLYIHLYANPMYFLKNQLLAEKLDTNIYKMIPQWHTSSFIIHRDGAQKTLAHLPFGHNIDHIYGELIPELNSIFYKNSMFNYKGLIHYNDTVSELGSIALHK